MLPRSERCSQHSEARGESLAGTASTVRSWLLIEDGGPWGREALLDARLPEGAGPELLRRCRAAQVRPLLIRRTGTSVREGLSCFAIRSGPEPPWMERTRLSGFADALDIDLLALGRGERPGLEPHDDPLFLVCTHGRRDVCCAERGRPVAQALAGRYPDQAWESSHVGGDRFAGNVVAFPHGLYFGRVGAEASDVADAYAAGRISLPHLRGRSCLPMPVQAAEQAVREHTGFDGVDDVRFEGAERDADDWTATFGTTRGRFVVSVRVERSDTRFLTCRSRREEAPRAYRVLALRPHDVR